MYTAVLQVIIYQLAKYEKDRIENDREIAEPIYSCSGKEIKEKLDIMWQIEIHLEGVGM